MQQVMDGVFELRVAFVNVHLVVTDDGVVLVDTGLPGRWAARKIDNALHDVRRAVGDVTAILLTHRHPDHTGGVAELRRRSGARVVAHESDAPAIRGEVTPALTPLQRTMDLLLPKAAPSPLDEVLTGDGPVPVPGFHAVHTPGHTAGHLSYVLDRDGGLLFAGDAAAGRGRGKVGRTPQLLTEDTHTADASIARLAELAFDVAVFGHGRAVSGGAVDRFRELVAG